MSKIDNNIDPTLHEFMDDFYKKYKEYRRLQSRRNNY